MTGCTEMFLNKDRHKSHDLTNSNAYEQIPNAVMYKFQDDVHMVATANWVVSEASDSFVISDAAMMLFRHAESPISATVEIKIAYRKKARAQDE